MIVKKIDNLSLETKYSFSAEFFNDLDKFNKLRTQKEKKNVYDTFSELYNNLLERYFDEYYDLSDAKRIKIGAKYDPANLALDEYDYNEWYKKIIR